MEGLHERLRSHVFTLAEAIGERNIFLPEALRAAESYIEEEWRRQGYHVKRLVQPMEGIDCANLEITVPGVRNPEDIVVVGAHYDSVFGSPGADDNASGVAGLLELSRLFRSTPPDGTVRLVAFTNEEPPFFATRHMGSLNYAKAARRRGDSIRLMISLEMLGCYCQEAGSQRYPPLLKPFFPDRGNFIAFVSDWRSRTHLRRMVRAFRSHSEFPVESLAAPWLVPGVAASDHFSFWRQGYRAMMVTDTAFYRNPWYHTGGDLPQRLDYRNFARVVDGLRGALLDGAADGDG